MGEIDGNAIFLGVGMDEDLILRFRRKGWCGKSCSPGNGLQGRGFDGSVDTPCIRRTHPGNEHAKACRHRSNRRYSHVVWSLRSGELAGRRTPPSRPISRSISLARSPVFCLRPLRLTRRK
ncbi:hypothetical protein SJ05684_c22700 [Sinorhizobium sojae CCBAU 05684]|uniref:Uncharacterized protein n=1 Tax=Sinorhizobium sojae CCBAU 05684 TaxID=716928 RepID=A0A249PCR5_9HYPH|nr:hypothetical protein SJ05684_c22700 [Sinorhizobium sojae CCBAU 05684]